ncbi:hypothetical protein [Neorhizobium sp. NCHU2750]|uniref:hypothetical protein n=1 Tax=Neorhizobium sp. NCHU2750 TaxID=1825976 RepID=UPI000E72A248
MTDGGENHDKPGLRRVFEKFAVDRPAKIVLVEHHLSTKTNIRCLIRTISLQGAELEVSPNIAVPSHFFLAILGIRDEIGCTVMLREEEKVTVGFNMLIDPEFLHHVLRLGFETSQ